MTRDNLLWLAGYLEGEGCFSITHFKCGNRRQYRLAICSTDEDVLKKAAFILGKHVPINRQLRNKKNRKWKTAYIIDISGALAIGLMMTLYALMGKRRRAAIRDVIADWKAYRTTNTPDFNGVYGKIGERATLQVV